MKHSVQPLDHGLQSFQIRKQGTHSTPADRILTQMICENKAEHRRDKAAKN